MDRNLPSDGELLDRYRQGHDRAALSALLERHRSLAYRVALGVLGSPADAEDAAQDAFVRLLACAPRMRVQPSLAGLVARVALRSAQQLARSANRRRAREAEAACPESTGLDLVYEAVTRQETERMVRQAVVLLDERYRLPILLHYFEGLSTGETAEALGISRTAVTTRLSRAVGQLRRRLARAGQALTVPALIALLRAKPVDAGPPALADPPGPACAVAPAAANGAPVLAAGLPAKLAAAALVVVCSLGGFAALRRLPPPQAGAASPPALALYRPTPYGGAPGDQDAGTAARSGDPRRTSMVREAARSGDPRRTSRTSMVREAARSGDLRRTGTVVPPRAVTVRGTVFGPGEGPLPGVSVFLFVGDRQVGSAEMDARGRYELAGPSPGLYVVVARKAGFVSQRQSTPALGARRVAGVSFRLRSWQTTPWSIAGTVLREDGKTPLAGATVVVCREWLLNHFEERVRAATDETGAYGFARLEPGRYRLRVSAPGYDRSRDEAHELALDAGSNRRMADVTLLRPEAHTLPGTVSGRILDAGGQALANRAAEVHMRGESADTRTPWGEGLQDPSFPEGRPSGPMVRREVSGRVTTDAEGPFQCTVPPGSYTLLVSVEGFISQTRPVGVPPGGPGEAGAFRLAARPPAPAQPVAANPPPNRVRGAVLRPDGTPLANTGVYLFASPWSVRPETPLGWGYAVTDAAGRFEKALEAEPGDPRGAMVSLKTRGFAATAGVQLPLREGETAEFYLREPSARIVGQVADPGGRGIAGARVFAYRSETQRYGGSAAAAAVQPWRGGAGPAGPWPASASVGDLQPGVVPGLLAAGTHYAETGTDGRYVLAELDPGTYELAARAPGWSPGDRPGVTLGTGPAPPTVSFTLARLGAVDGVVLRPEGKPLAHTEVRLVDFTGTGGVDSVTRTDARGRYRLPNLAPGDHRIAAKAPGYTALARNGVAVRVGETTGGVDFHLPAGLSLRGRALKTDGTPAAGAIVRLHQGALPRDGVGIPAGPDGGFVLDGLTPGPAAVEVSLAGCTPATAGASIPQAPEAPLEVRLAPSITLTGTVRDEAGKPVASAGVLWMPGDRSPYAVQPLQQVKTDAEGRYVLVDIPAGQAVVQAYVPGCRGDLVEPDLTGRSGEVALGLSVAKLRFGRLRGRVLRADGTPAAGIEVRPTPEEPCSIPASATTDARGEFTCGDVPAGHGWLVLGSLDAGPPCPRYAVRPDVENLLPDVHLAPAGRIEGRVRGLGNAVGKGLPEVLTFPPQVVGKDGRRLVPADGVRLYKPGTWRLSPAGLRSERHRPGLPAQYLLDGAGEAYCVYPEGSRWVPLSEFDVLPDLSAARIGAVSADGSFRIGAATGPALVVLLEQQQAQQPGNTAELVFTVRRSVPVVVQAGEPTPVEVTLEPGGTVSGRVVGPDGLGVPGVRVTFHRRETMEWVGRAGTRADGSFLVAGVPPGDYLASAWEFGVAGLRRPFAVRAGQTTALDLRLERGVALRGRGEGERPGALFVSAESDTSLGGARVQEDGAFSLDWLLPGTYTLRLWASGESRVVTQTGVQVPEGGADGLALRWQD